MCLMYLSECTMIGCVSCNDADLCTACDRGYEKIFGACVYRETTIDPETSTLQLLQQDLNHASSRTFASTLVPASTSTSTSATSPFPIPNTFFSGPLTHPPMYETGYHSIAETVMSQTDGVSATWGATSRPTVIANEFTDGATDASIRGGEGGGGEEEEEEEKEKEEEEEEK
ncbi:uncharacterized protein LOC125027452 isoform X2 [Penaeus chinensis]|uniref:uncharacterized protein LOC125027452 isoform X2 n=1 Tax=Penaeus chinensis TaxID=139456 RepID=UPI001FB73DC3|nr:uncharacterized protein LOC125027452 isoform X2 [Penaeus chinensis]